MGRPGASASAAMARFPETLSLIHICLLATLLEGWDQIRTAPEHAAPQGNPLWPAGAEPSPAYGGYPAVFAPGAAAEYASQSWSL